MAPEIVPNEFSLFGTKIVPNKLNRQGQFLCFCPFSCAFMLSIMRR